MPLKTFTIPETVDTRLIQHREMLYKFKIQYLSRDMKNIKLPCSRKELNSEVQRAIQALLCTKGEQLPIKTKHFFINCDKLPWKAGRKLKFKKRGKDLIHNPDVHILTVISIAELDDESDPHASKTNVNTIRQSGTLSENGRSPQQPSSSRPIRRLITKSPVRSEKYFTRSKRTSVIDTGQSKKNKKLYQRKLPKTGAPHTGLVSLFDNVTSGAESLSHDEVEHNPPDRHIIEQEEIQENMKLQQLASPTSVDPSVTNDQETQRSSLLGSIVDAFLRPVQRVFEGTG